MGMVLQGTPATPLPEELLAVFRLAMVDVEDERRGKESEPDMGLIRPRTRRNTAVVQSGVDSLLLMEQAFSMGVYAVCGWQIPPLVPSDSAVGSADYLGVLRLLSMVDRDASLREIEAVVHSNIYMQRRQINPLPMCERPMGWAFRKQSHVLLPDG